MQSITKIASSRKLKAIFSSKAPHRGLELSELIFCQYIFLRYNSFNKSAKIVNSSTLSKFNISSNLEFNTLSHHYKMHSLQRQVQEIKIANS